MISSLCDRVAALRRTHKQALLLSRARVVNQLKAARNKGYRAQRQRALEHLDAQLRELDAGVGEEGKPVIATFAEDVPNGALLK